MSVIENIRLVKCHALQCLPNYAHALHFADLPAAVVHHCKRCVADTFGCALGGFDAELSQIARDMARRASVASGARVGSCH